MLYFSDGGLATETTEREKQRIQRHTTHMNKMVMWDKWVLFVQQCLSGKDKDLLPGKTSFPLWPSRAGCCRHSRLSTLGQGQPRARPLLQSLGQHWHLLVSPRWAGELCVQQQTHFSTDLQLGEWWASNSSLLDFPSGSERCHGGNDLPALCVCF